LTLPTLVLLQKIIAVEGLDLTAVEPGWYHQICLPAKLQGSDGAPIRCLLQPLAEGGGGGRGHTEL
jgi:kynurenine formamidase